MYSEAPFFFFLSGRFTLILILSLYINPQRGLPRCYFSNYPFNIAFQGPLFSLNVNCKRDKLTLTPLAQTLLNLSIIAFMIANLSL